MLAGIVLRAPPARARNIKAIGLVHHRRIVAVAQLQRRGINKGLEGRTGLPVGHGRPVERTRHLGLAPAHHGAHRAVGRHHHDRRLRLRTVLHLLVEHRLQRLLGGTLNALIERGADQNVLGRVAGKEIRPRFHHPIGEIATGLGLRRLRQRGGVVLRLLHLGLAQVPLLIHQPQHSGRPVMRAFEVGGWRQPRRRGQQPGHDRGLLRGHLGRVTPEIPLRRRLGSKGAAAPYRPG